MTAPWVVDGWTVDPADRTTFYGATDVARILGVDRFGGPMDVWLEKVHKLVRPTGRAARWGQLLEAAICQGYAEDRGVELRRVAEVIRRDVAPLMVVHPDRIVLHSRGLLDAKATRFLDYYGEAGSDEVPPSVRLQMTVLLGHTRRAWADVAVLSSSTGGLDLFRVEPSTELYEASLGAVDDFHRAHVITGIPPAPDGSDAWERWLARLPDDGESMLPATAEQMVLVRDLESAARSAGAAAARLEQAKQAVQDVMGARRALPTPLGTITWKSQRPSPRWASIAAAVAAEAGLDLAPFLEADKAGRPGPRVFRHPWSRLAPEEGSNADR